jgi:hypothetical protein
VSVRRLEFLQWFGLIFGGVTWFTLFITGVGVSVAACNPAGHRWSLPYDTVQIALLASGLCALAAAEAASILVFRATRGAKDDDPPRIGRQRFFAIGAMTGNLLFLVILVLSELATIVDRACHQG